MIFFGILYLGYKDDGLKFICLFVGIEYIFFDGVLLWYFIEFFFGIVYLGIGDVLIFFGCLFVGML